MKMEDTQGLFKCYSNQQAAKYFDGDCCNDDFYYTDFDRFVECLEFWESRYAVKDFVQFTIIETETDEIIGMAEVCPSYKYSRKVLKSFQFVPAKEECNISFNDYFVKY